MNRRQGVEDQAQDASKEAERLASLLAACALHDRDAFARLYRSTSSRLYAVAVRILRREDWAEEALQDSYVRIWTNAAEYRSAVASPMSWMTSIVRNRCLDGLRRPRVEVRDEHGTLGDSVPSESAPPPADLERLRTAEALARCLAALEGGPRQAIALAYYEGLSHSELSARLREPLGTVKSWVRRGLLRMKDCLELQGQA